MARFGEMGINDYKACESQVKVGSTISENTGTLNIMSFRGTTNV
jgi:hypothetical protein